MVWSIWKIEPSLMPLVEYVNSQVRMVAVRVPRSNGHKYVQDINKQFPFPYRHLKRTKPDDNDLVILIGPAGENEYKLDGAIGYTEYLVPALPPLTREQYDAGSKIWPMVFHDSKKEDITFEFDNTVQTIVRDNIDCLLKIHDVCILDKGGNLLSGGCRNDKHPLGHPVMDAIAESAKVIKPPAYLCTDCIVICKREPCLMCAMALLHSRVAAVVFVDSLELDSPYSAPFCLQSRSGLNHYYKVYKASKEIIV